MLLIEEKGNIYTFLLTKKAEGPKGDGENIFYSAITLELDRS